MGLPRISVVTMIFAVALLAVDLGLLLGHLKDLVKPLGGNVAFLLGLLPMANALALTLPHLIRHRGRVTPFVAGFLVAGGVATCAVVAIVLAMPEPFAPLFGSLFASNCKFVCTVPPDPFGEPAALIERCGEALLNLVDLVDDHLGLGSVEVLTLLMATFSLPPCTSP